MDRLFFQERGQSLGQLLQAFFRLGIHARVLHIQETAHQVAFEDQGIGGLERAAHGLDLDEDVGEVLVRLDHGLDAPDLALDAAQTGQDVLAQFLGLDGAVAHKKEYPAKVETLPPGLEDLLVPQRGRRVKQGAGFPWEGGAHQAARRRAKQILISIK